MESSWAFLLLVGLVTAAPTESPKATEEALSRFIEIYNQGPNVQNAFRVFQARPQPAQVSEERRPVKRAGPAEGKDRGVAKGGAGGGRASGHLL